MTINELCEVNLKEKRKIFIQLKVNAETFLEKPHVVLTSFELEPMETLPPEYDFEVWVYDIGHTFNEGVNYYIYIMGMWDKI